MKIIYLILVLLFALACKPAQNISTVSTENLHTRINHDVVRTDTLHLDQTAKNGIQTAFKQHLNVVIVTTSYDTNKGIVPGTFKPPVKTITQMTLVSQKEQTGVDSSIAVTHQAYTSLMVDKSISDSTRVISENKKIKGTIRGYQTFLMWCGGLVLLGLVLYFGIKMGWKWLV